MADLIVSVQFHDETDRAARHALVASLWEDLERRPEIRPEPLAPEPGMKGAWWDSFGVALLGGAAMGELVRIVGAHIGRKAIGGVEIEVTKPRPGGGSTTRKLTISNADPATMKAAYEELRDLLDP